MNLLLDTHLILWWMAADPLLSEIAREYISSPSNQIFISAASVWEIRIKQGLGKVKLPDDFAKLLSDESFSSLPVRIEHAHAVAALPLLHRDPFDRILIAQAQLEQLTLLTHDKTLAKYDASVFLV